MGESIGYLALRGRQSDSAAGFAGANIFHGIWKEAFSFAPPGPAHPGGRKRKIMTVTIAETHWTAKWGNLTRNSKQLSVSCILIALLILATGCTGESEFELVSLRSKDTITGSLFLGSGSINGTEYLYFRFRFPGSDGMYSGKMPASETVIYWVETKPVVRARILSRIFCDSGKGSILPSYKTACWISASFYIPRGSISDTIWID